MKRRKLSLPEVKAVFSSEYSSLLRKFDIHDLTLDKAEGDTSLSFNSPGIYVFWNENFGVIRVGKSQSNSKVRSLQHIRDNTRNDKLEMKSLKNDPKTHLILFIQYPAQARYALAFGLRTLHGTEPFPFNFSR